MAFPDPPPVDPYRQLQAAIAGELRQLRRDLEALAETLVCDPHFAAGYLDQLQAFDLLGQFAEESAGVLQRLADGADAEGAVAGVRVGAVQARLRAAITPAQAA